MTATIIITMTNKIMMNLSYTLLIVIYQVGLHQNDDCDRLMMDLGRLVSGIKQ